SSTLFCLWTGLSLPVALHLASQRRSYLQLRTGQCSRPERTFTLLLVRTFRRTYPGTSYLATISLSLRDNFDRRSPLRWVYEIASALSGGIHKIGNLRGASKGEWLCPGGTAR